MSAKPFYITTAIDYANGKPHLGHAYEKVLTDVIARFKRMQGEQVHFLTGLDEHGQKVQQTAAKLGVSPQENCDRVAVDFRRLLVDLSITNDDFIRTTESRHKAVVQKHLQQLFDAGLVYKAEYTGYYSVRQEQFVLEKDKNPDGTWPELFGEVNEITESNYFFRLTQFRDRLWDFLHSDAGKDWIYPAFRQKQVVEFLKEPINDLCISRPKSRLSWGIELPFDTEFVTYVWFDALVNYVSAVENLGVWPADAHVIGKDILVPPHAVYWPCMLMALELPLPKRLVVHGWWSMSGAKIAKSTGVGGGILDLAKLYGTDPFRYYLIREMAVGQDADFNADQLAIRYRTDLGNALGNLLNRLLSVAGRSTESLVPAAPVTQGAQASCLHSSSANGTPSGLHISAHGAASTAAEFPGEEAFEKSLRALWAEVIPAYLDAADGYRFDHGLDKLWEFVRAMNRYIEDRAPWKLAKSAEPADRARLEATLAHIAEGLRLTAVAVTPVMPAVSAKILETLGSSAVDKFAGELDWSWKSRGWKLASAAILFPPVLTEEEAAAAAAAPAKPAKPPKPEKK